VTVDPSASHRSTPAELAERLEAERRGRPFLLFRDEEGLQRIVEPGERDRLSIGRGGFNDVALPWDPKVSRVHAELASVGGAWVVEDDGLSRNGTFVNEQRINGRRRLRDGDVIRVGGAALRFSDPFASATTAMTVPDRQVAAAPPSDAQRRVLVALCRPLAADETGATPATNREIAEELYLSLDAVKTHLRALFEKFEIGEEAQNRKRALLARRALDSGVVSRRELETPPS
jgi:pSer/pThr/pTyr-binding forkhead associated (FHA) protein